MVRKTVKLSFIKENFFKFWQPKAPLETAAFWFAKTHEMFKKKKQFFTKWEEYLDTLWLFI